MSQNGASAAPADEDSIIDPAPATSSNNSSNNNNNNSSNNNNNNSSNSNSDPLPALPPSTPTSTTNTTTTTATTSAVYAKTSKVDHLTHLLRQLDTLIFIQLGAAYYHDNLTFLLALRALSQVLYVQPKPTGFVINGLAPALVVNVLCILTHLLHDRPEAASRYARGWIHGGLLIDFVGERGPISRWTLLAYDLLIVLLQVVMLMVGHERRRAEGADGVAADWEKYSAGAGAGAGATGGSGASQQQQQQQQQQQDLDAEEAGFRRSLEGVDAAAAAEEDEDEEENQYGEDGIEMDRLLQPGQSQQRRRRRRSRHRSSMVTTAGGMSEDSDLIAVIHVKESLKQLARRPPALSQSTATDTGERAARARALLGRLLADRLAVAR